MYFINEKFAVYLSCEKATENSGHNLAAFEQPSFEGQIIWHRIHSNWHKCGLLLLSFMVNNQLFRNFIVCLYKKTKVIDYS